MRFPILACLLLTIAACHDQAATNQTNAAAPDADENAMHGVEAKRIDRSHKGQPFPAVEISDPYGKPTDLRDFYVGKAPFLLNLWATWCAPCVKELPTLNAISHDEAPGVLVVSQDSGPQASVAAFLTNLKAYNLQPYQDPKMALSGKLGAEVLPTSILFDANGREVWRYVGDLDWTRPDAAKLLAEAGAPAAH